MPNFKYPRGYDDEFLNAFKKIIDYLNTMGYTYEESLQKAYDILEEAKQTNNMNVSVQQQINDVVAGAADPDSELAQARGGHTVVNGRLTAIEDDIKRKVVNLKDYGAVGDGVTDDTDAINNALNNLEAGGIFVVPEGVYASYKFSFSGKKNCQFIMVGTFKWIDGADENAFTVISQCDHSIFYNLKIDGNRANVVNREINGDQPNISISSDQKGLRFVNPENYNAVFCGFVLNGGISDLTIENPYFENVGEHPFYISGGGNENVSIKNITVDGMGQNSWYETKSHECSVLKIRKTSKGTNKNIEIDGINYTHKSAPADLTVLNALTVDGLEVKKVRAKEIPLAIFSGMSDDIIKRVSFKDVEALRIFHSVTMQGELEDLSLSDGEFTGSMTFIDIFDRVERCIFDNAPFSLPNINGNLLSKKTQFIDCQFKENNDSRKLNFLNVKDDIRFERCVFTTLASSTSELMVFGSQETTKPVITFSDCDIDAPNFNYSITQSEGVDIRLIDFKSNKRMRSTTEANGILSLEKATVPSHFISTPDNPPRIKASDVKDFEGNDLLRKDAEISISSGNTLSSWTPISGFLFPPKINDITITPVSPANGYGSYWLNFDGNRYNIHVSNGPSAQVKFMSKIEIKEKIN